MRRILCVDDVQYIGAYSWNDTTKWSTYVRTTYFYTLRIFFGMNSGASRFQLQFLSFSLPHIRIPVRSVLSIAVCRCCILLRFVRAYTHRQRERERDVFCFSFSPCNSYMTVHARRTRLTLTFTFTLIPPQTHAKGICLALVKFSEP